MHILNLKQKHKTYCNNYIIVIAISSLDYHGWSDPTSPSPAKNDRSNSGGSQVPQPTCYWKWVGSTIPLKQDNLTLQASRAFNMARTLKEVYFLE